MTSTGVLLCCIFLNKCFARTSQVIEPRLLEQQCGFHPGRGTIDQLWVVRQVIEKVIEHDSSVHICFVDLSKAFDSVPRHALVSLLKEYSVEEEVCKLIIDTYSDTRRVVRTKGGKSDRFRVTTSVRQGCCLSPVYLPSTWTR